MIKCLTTFGYVIEWLVLNSVPQRLPTLLFHFKYFCFENMWFADGHGLAFLLVLIKCSPNLEKIKLEVINVEYPVVWEEYSDVWLEHLNELEIICFSNSKHEIEFVKFILARSPKLSKVNLRSMGCEKERLEMLVCYKISYRPHVQVVIYV
ncbi:putative FBD domain-containing protein [Helianthus anomalus]